ncbi:11409_t:CDS:2 [Diversispora eburnea]|uniref:11409_t:CDS:1 n=1 Tax=Diversispora eburnea TaxID=1213867 RepID=A0A9N8VTA4_9GLOM|nr:11409_t:CDS:2 [Diversispora eburnea]
MNFKKLYESNPLQKKFADILFERADEPATESSWSTFSEKDALVEDELLRSYYRLADANKSTSVKSVLDQAEKDVKSKDPRLVHHTLMKFASTYPDAKALRLRVPPLIRRAPKSTKPRRRPTVLAPGPMIGVPGKTPENLEDLIEYWREDPNLNEHHEKWHLVYGKNRVDDPNSVERLSVGLAEVIPLENYLDPIPEGYDAEDVAGFGSRAANLTLRDIPNFSTVQNLADARDRLVKTIDQGYFDDLTNSKSIKTEGSIDSLDLLAVAIEAGITDQTYKNYDAAVWGTNYVAFHNIGHIMIAFIKEGVIGDNKTACRDPVFYRWHKYVDDLFVRYQSKLPANNYNDAPNVVIHSQDVAIVFKDKIDPLKGLTKRVDIEKAAQTWGETHFDHLSKHDVGCLETKIKTRKLQLDGEEQETEIQYLFPREWYYFFRDVDVTFRVFIVPTQYEKQFERYIEVDKFPKTLKAHSKTVIARDCDRSSVVAQPPRKLAADLDDNADPETFEDIAEDVDNNPNYVGFNDYCECGWPFHLVLPRGNPNGMPFKLVVFLSSGELDKIDAGKKCGSLSFCGSQELAGKYPDKKEMGYPFNRPLKNGNLRDTFGHLKNVAIKEIKIKNVADFPEFTKAA